MARILFIQPFDFPTIRGQKRRKRFFISRSQFEVGYQITQENDFSVLDLNLAIRQRISIAEAIRRAVGYFEPQMIFLTYPSFPQGEQVALVLRGISRISNNIPVVMGGGAISLIEDAPLRWWPNMNIACCYNGFGNQVSSVIQNGLTGINQDIPGVFYAKRKSSLKINPEEKLVDFYKPEDLYSAGGRLDFPSYLESIRKYGFNPRAIVELTRGCLYRCSFCAVNRHNFGFFSRSSKTVANEIEYLAELGVASFRFADPTFGLEKEKTNSLLEAMVSVRERYPKIQFEITTRANVVSKENARLFHEAGITRCDLGMETMSETDLASVHKDVRKERLRGAVGYLAKAGIETKLFHITFPGRISIPTIQFLLELSRNNVPFLVQSAYLRKIPNPQSPPLFSRQDQKVFCEKSDSIEQLMEWMLLSLAFKSTNTSFHEPLLQDELLDILSQGIEPKNLFEISQSTGEVMLKFRRDFEGRRYFFRHTKKAPFMWCLRKEL